MWISSSSIKNRVSDRGRIDIFYRGSISGWKASLLLLALASFSVVCAASDLPDWCRKKPDTCFAKNLGELKEGQWKGIGIDGDKITWDATDDSKDAPSIELYSQECGKLSFIMSKPDNLGDDCKFSMQYPVCDLELEWQKKDLKFSKKGEEGGFFFTGATVNIELNGAHFTDGKNPRPALCDFKPSPVGDKWCKFDFAFNKIGSCDGKIQLGTDYKLLATPAPTTAAPETTPTTDATSIAATDPNNANAIDPNNANTTPGADAAGLSPWIIVAIVVGVLIFVAAGVGLIVFLICRRKRGSAQNMAEKGTVGSNYQCETVVPPTKSTLCADQPYQSESAASSVHSKKDRKAEDERSKPTSQVEVAKTVSQKNAKNVPDPSPSPLPEENKPKRILTPDELYEPLGDPAKAIPMHLSEKKISEKKKGHGMNFANRKFGKKLPQT